MLFRSVSIDQSENRMTKKNTVSSTLTNQNTTVLTNDRCGGCGRGKVPDILMTTVEPPPGLDIVGQGGLIQVTIDQSEHSFYHIDQSQARVLKQKKDLKGENNAREVMTKTSAYEMENIDCR